MSRWAVAYDDDDDDDVYDDYDDDDDDDDDYDDDDGGINVIGKRVVKRSRRPRSHGSRSRRLKSAANALEGAGEGVGRKAP